MGEYSEAVKEFYRVYRPLQKKHNLRMHSRFSIYDDGFIEIWEYTGEKRGQMRMQGKRRKRRRVLQKSDRGTAKLWKRKRGRKT